MVTDPISEMIIGIKNANLVRLLKAVVFYSRLKWSIAQLLKREGFIADCEVIKDKDSSYQKIEIHLKYADRRKTVITDVKRWSKPGRRIYTGLSDLKKYRKSFGITILSTPKGVITEKEAFRERIGGEVLCSVW